MTEDQYLAALAQLVVDKVNAQLGDDGADSPVVQLDRRYRAEREAQAGSDA